MSRTGLLLAHARGVAPRWRGFRCGALSLRRAPPFRNAIPARRPRSSWRRLAARRPVRAGDDRVSRRRLRDVMGRDWILGYLLLLPAIAVLVGLIAYPFLYAIYLSLQNKPIGAPGTFVGFQNFLTLWRSPTFYQVIRNTLIVMVVGVGLKFLAGLMLALILNERIKYREPVARAAVLSVDHSHRRVGLQLAVDPRRHEWRAQHGARPAGDHRDATSSGWAIRSSPSG